MSAREAVERYNLELWNDQRYDIAPDIIDDEMIRNSPGSRTVLTRAEALDRIKGVWAGHQSMVFELLHTIVDGDLCTIVYQATMKNTAGEPRSIASIEVFRVVNGRIVEVWNNSHDDGRWPELAEES